MTTSNFTKSENAQQAIYELLCALHAARGNVLDNESIRNMINHLLVTFERRMEVLKNFNGDADEFESDWGAMMWGLLSVLSRMPAHSHHDSIVNRLNCMLITLVNEARPIRPPRGIEHSHHLWQNFFSKLAGSLHTLHDLYQQFQITAISLQGALQEFANLQLVPTLDAFRRLCLTHHSNVRARLRRAQLQKMCNFDEISTDLVQDNIHYYNNFMYTIGIFAGRLQGFRFEALQVKAVVGYVDGVDNVRVLMESVFSLVDELYSDCLYACVPSTTAILVTNNLFQFNCRCLLAAAVFKDFHIQIVGEDTAAAIQADMTKVLAGTKPASHTTNYPSAALLAMKPTSGVKRNNATAHAEGGNTAHKKSDVNSKESVALAPTADDGMWSASYPHLLCTTRQKDTVLMDARSGQMGKRPLFYFHIKGSVYSPTGNFSYIRTLSLPFTIATRRNQDCQVQRMMSSYTATCFWLYGTSSIDGLIFNWVETGIEWSRFKELYRAYFTVNAEVKRVLDDSDFTLLHGKIECDECRQACHMPGNEKLITFKNVLCPHLKYDTEMTTVRFSIWRGILEVLQIFQDQRTSVKQIWDDYILMGFTDQTVIEDLLRQHTTAIMCLRISNVLAGSVCVSLRNNDGEILHLEPIDLKKLQTKSVFDYLADIAASSKINYVLTAKYETIRVHDIVLKYNIGAETVHRKEICSNVTHLGDVKSDYSIRYTPLRIAVVTCPNTSSPQSLNQIQSSSSNNGTLFANNIPQQLMQSSFELELESLMKSHGKSIQEVVQYLGGGYANYQPFADPYLLNTEYP